MKYGPREAEVLDEVVTRLRRLLPAAPGPNDALTSAVASWRQTTGDLMVCCYAMGLVDRHLDHDEAAVEEAKTVLGELLETAAAMYREGFLETELLTDDADLHALLARLRSKGG